MPPSQCLVQSGAIIKGSINTLKPLLLFAQFTWNFLPQIASYYFGGTVYHNHWSILICKDTQQDKLVYAKCQMNDRGEGIKKVTRGRGLAQWEVTSCLHARQQILTERKEE